MKKMIKLNLKEANSDCRFPNKLISCPSFSLIMALREVKLSKTPLFEFNMKAIAYYSGTYS